MFAVNGDLEVDGESNWASTDGRAAGMALSVVDADGFLGIFGLIEYSVGTKLVWSFYSVRGGGDVFVLTMGVIQVCIG